MQLHIAIENSISCFLGPNISGNEEFDKHCYFANNVAMTEAQVAYLRRQVAITKPPIPFYVFTTTKSNVQHGKAKMVNFELV